MIPASRSAGVITGAPSGTKYGVSPGQVISVNNVDVAFLMALGFFSAPPLDLTNGIDLGSLTNTDPIAFTINNGQDFPPLPVLANSTIYFVGSGTNMRTVIMNIGAAANSVTFALANGTYAAPSAVLAHTNLGVVNAFGWGATGWSNGSKVSVILQTSQDWTDSAQGTRLLFNVTPNDSTINATAMTLENDGGLQVVKYVIGTSTGPTITSGTGAPNSTQPKGSLYTREDGGIGSTLYISQGAGTWNPVAAV